MILCATKKEERLNGLVVVYVLVSSHSVVLSVLVFVVVQEQVQWHAYKEEKRTLIGKVLGISDTFGAVFS